MTDYLLTNDDDERVRLIGQSRWLEPSTRKLFADAGLAPGMRVLDFGSGAGDVALLARTFVGSEGRVVGVDRDAAQVAFANDRVATLGHANVSFVVGDATMLPDGPFDAVVGRLVLLYAADSAATLAALAARVVPGGIIAFQEMDIPDDRDAPDVWPPRGALLERVIRVATRTIRAVGVQIAMGRRLPALLDAFGTVQAEAFTPLFTPEAGQMWVDLLVSLLPQAEALGISAPGEFDVAALRALPDVPGSTALVYPLVAAWARRAA